MDQFDQQIKKTLLKSAVSVQFLQRIIVSLEKLERDRLTRRLMWLRAAFTLFSAAFVFLIIRSASEFHLTGFDRLFSLLFSDTSIVLKDWQNYAWSLLEALPVLFTAAVLASLALLVWTAHIIHHFSKSSRNFFINTHST